MFSFFSSEISFPKEKAKDLPKKLTADVLIFIFCVIIFAACNSEPEMGTDLIYGSWVSSYGEEYLITNTTFTSKTGGIVNLAGTIENIREDGSGAGYITIKFTENSSTYLLNGDPLPAIGRFYVIHYKELSTLTVQLSQAYSNEDPDKIKADWGEYGSGSAGGAAGKETLALAESAYTVQKGYFNAYSVCQKQ